MLPYIRPVLLAFVGAVCVAGTAFSSLADDSLNRAVDLFREKNFAAALASAGKSSDLTRRSFVSGMAALRLEKYEEAAVQLADAEKKLPLIADYALLFQAEALLKAKQYPAAATKAASIRTLFPSSKLIRRSEKLSADIFFEAKDFKGALALYQSYIEKYASGADAVDASYKSALCREELSDGKGALLIYRSLWLNSPSSPLSSKSLERIKQLERSGIVPAPYTAEELLKRATTLYAQNEFSSSLKTLEMIPTQSQPQSIANRIDLRTGMAHYRLRQYKLAEKKFVAAATSPVPGVRSEARFWLAKSLDRQDLKERALAQYLELAGEGKKQDFADDALIEAGGLKRGLGLYAEAARLFDQAAKVTTEPKSLPRLAWESGWCRYLAGEYPAAVDLFKGLLADDAQREKALYWLGRTLDKTGDAASAAYFRTLQDEFPAGFYATWYRDQKGIKDSREPLGSRDAMTELPAASGYDKPRLLASLGMLEDARVEMAALVKKSGEKKSAFPMLARLYLEMRDYGSAISLFLQNRPVAWEKATVPLWTAGYPRAYTELVSQNAARNGLSEGLLYALIRAESAFAPAIKSGAGAIGLMQMMPATARMTAREKGEFDPQRLTAPELNIRLGTKHLADLMKEHNGDVIYMAAAYNAGSGALERWKKSFKSLQKDEFIESIPYQETRDYVKKVFASAATYRQLYGLK